MTTAQQRLAEAQKEYGKALRASHGRYCPELRDTANALMRALSDALAEISD